MRLSLAVIIVSSLLFTGVFGQSSADTASAAERDSIVRIVPIKDLGRLEPYSRSTRTITSDDITWKEYRSLYDIIAAEPGFFIRDLASPGHENQLAINGIDEKNIAVMVDGIPFNDVFTGTYNLWNIPVDAIDRIEIITGPHSSFYDGISSGGAINIVLKSYFNNRAYTRLRYSQGVDGYTQTDALFAQNIIRSLNLTLGLTHYGFGSNKEIQNYIGRFPNSNDDAWGIRGKLRYDPADYFSVSYTYLFNRSWTGLNGGVDYNTSPSIFNGLQATVQNYDAYEKIFNNHSLISIAYAPASDSSQLFTLSGYYFDNMRQYRDEENRSNRNGILRSIDEGNITRGLKAQYLFTLPFNRLSLYYDAEDHSALTASPVSVFGINDVVDIAAFLRLSGFLTATDKIHSAGAEGTILVSDNLSLFGGISSNTESRASRIPSSFARDESISQIEGGIHIVFEKTFESTISIFRNTMTHPIVIDTTGAASYLRPDQFIFSGVSASAHAQWNDFHAEGTAAILQQPSLIRDSSSVQEYPELTLDGSVYFHGLLAKGHLDLRIGLRGRFYSKQTGMKPLDENGLWIPSTTVEYGPAGAMDFFAIGKIGDAYIHFIWENVTGSQYMLSPIYPMYDRNIRFGVSWEFTD
ncbi:MAG: putative porin [Bacteroidota bacterium]